MNALQTPMPLAASRAVALTLAGRNLKPRPRHFAPGLTRHSLTGLVLSEAGRRHRIEAWSLGVLAACGALAIVPALANSFQLVANRQVFEALVGRLLN